MAETKTTYAEKKAAEKFGGLENLYTLSLSEIRTFIFSNIAQRMGLVACALSAFRVSIQHQQ